MYNSAIAVLKGIRAEFAKGLKNAPDSVIKKFTAFVKSDNSDDSYFIGDVVPAIKEWLDEINFKDLNDFELNVKNKEWANGTLVKRTTLSDSKKSLGGSLEMWIQGLVGQFKSLPDELINALLILNPNAFDGTAFFATSRPNLEGSNAISNIYSGTGVTLALVEADLSGARARLKAFKDRNGKPFNRGMKMLVYAPAQLETVFLKLANNEFLASGVTNLHKGTFELVINDDQAIANNDWYLNNIAAPMKPFLFQTREATKFMVKDDEFNSNIKYAATARSNASLLNPTAIVKVNN